MPNPDFASQWMEFARKDHEEAVLLRAHGFGPERIAIHLQQMMEKTLKAVLALEERSIPKTHDLVLLFQELGESLEGKEKYSDSCIKLSQLYLPARYPMPIRWEVTGGEVDAMMADAEDLFRAVEQIISNEKGQS